MADAQAPFTIVRLPADLAAKMEELKQDRDADRGKSVEELVREFCQEYVAVREMARWERAHMEQLNRSYQERPDDFDDAEVWEEVRRRAPEEESK
jgi:hypothetical protein